MGENEKAVAGIIGDFIGCDLEEAADIVHEQATFKCWAYRCGWNSTISDEDPIARRCEKQIAVDHWEKTTEEYLECPWCGAEIEEML